MSGTDNSATRDTSLPPPISLPTQGGLERIQENEVLSPVSTQPSKNTTKPANEHKVCDMCNISVKIHKNVI